MILGGFLSLRLEELKKTVLEEELTFKFGPLGSLINFAWDDIISIFIWYWNQA